MRGGKDVKREEIEAKELEALYDEKRDKLNARLSIWSLLITIFGAFSYAGAQPGITGYVVAFYPLLSGCVARFAGHSEQVLDRVKRRIYKIEEASCYAGYEHDNANESSSASGSGTHLKALRDFVLITDSMAIIDMVAQIFIDSLSVLIVLAILVEVVAVVATCVWMHDKPAHGSEKRTTGLLRNEAALDCQEREEARR